MLSHCSTTMSQQIRQKTPKAIPTCVQDWQPMIDAVFPENDTELTTLEVKRLAAATANSSHLKIHIHHQTLEQLPGEVIEVERDLLTTSKQLHRLNGIPECGSSVDKVVEPKEECKFQIEKFEGGDAETVAHVKHLVAVENGEIIDVNEEEQEQESESNPSTGLTFQSEIAQMCEKVEAASAKLQLD